MDSTEIERRLKIIGLVAAPIVALLVVWGVIAGLPEEPERDEPWRYQAYGLSKAEFDRAARGMWGGDPGWTRVGRGEMQRMFDWVCHNLDRGVNPLDLRAELWAGVEQRVTLGGAVTGVVRASGAYCPEHTDYLWDFYGFPGAVPVNMTVGAP